MKIHTAVLLTIAAFAASACSGAGGGLGGGGGGNATMTEIFPTPPTAIPPPSVPQRDGTAEGGQFPNVATTASFQLGKVSIGGSYNKDVASSVNFKVKGALSVGL